MTAGFDFPEEPSSIPQVFISLPNLRHLDRGSLQVDNGHFRSYEYVFGATAAAALYAAKWWTISPSAGNSSMPTFSPIAKMRTLPGAPS